MNGGLLKLIFLWGILSSQCFFCWSNTVDFSEKMAAKKRGCAQDSTKPYGYKGITLTLNKGQKKLLETLSINKNSTYDNFGALDQLLQGAQDFIHHLGNSSDQSKKVAEVLLDIAQQMIQISGHKVGWISIRAYTPSSRFRIPRWHTDGDFFMDDSRGTQTKLIINLKGDGTYFLKASDTFKKKFLDLEEKLIRENTEMEEMRFQLSDLVNQNQEEVSIYELPVYEAAEFNVGQGVHSAIHSEPDFKQPRLFMSVVAGSPEQIESLRKRWKADVTRLSG